MVYSMFIARKNTKKSNLPSENGVYGSEQSSPIMRPLFVALAVGALFACGEENQETVSMRVGHFRQTAIGVGPTLVYLVQEEEAIGTETWNYFYNGIEGFAYELGYVYSLAVEKIPVDDPPADGSSIRYTLKKIISKEAVDDTVSFEIGLKSVIKSNPPGFVTGSVVSGFELLSSVPIDCNTLCEELDQQLATKDEVIGTFTHAPGGVIRLVKLSSE